MKKTNRQGPARWGRFRFAIVGKLLIAPPERGQLRAALSELSEQLWEHPVTGEPMRISVPTLERWYYTARNAVVDPVGALDTKVRADRGHHRSIHEPLARVISQQYEEHSSWRYKLHYDNLASLARAHPELRPLPSYASVRRYMQARGLLKRPRKRKRDSNDPPRGKGHFEVRSYEHEYVNALWHLDFHVGSRALLDHQGQWRRPHLFACLDDRSRLCCHGQWYWDETAESLSHGLSQAVLKRGIPGELMTDCGAAMKSAEFREGLADLDIKHAMTLPYSPHQNAKAEIFWDQAEGRFLPMLEGCRDLTLALLNEAWQAFVEFDYNRGLHSEIGTTPLERFLSDKNVGRPSPDSDAVRRAFRVRVARQQRRSDGTISIAGQRFEVPSRYRHQKTIQVRYARWDLRHVDMVDGRTDTVLCRLFPVDKAQNADGRRRALQPLPEDLGGPVEPPPSGMAPLLRELMTEYSATGLPPAYLPKGEERADNDHKEEDEK